MEWKPATRIKKKKKKTTLLGKDRNCITVREGNKQHTKTSIYTYLFGYEFAEPGIGLKINWL